MKLIELLKDLYSKGELPKHNYYAQDRDGELYGYSGEPEYLGFGDWHGDGCSDFIKGYDRVEDYDHEFASYSDILGTDYHTATDSPQLAYQVDYMNEKVESLDVVIYRNGDRALWQNVNCSLTSLRQNKHVLGVVRINTDALNTIEIITIEEAEKRLGVRIVEEL